MITVTGSITGVSDEPLHVWITFKSKSTPIISAGVVIGNSTEKIKTVAVDGTFTIDLTEGKYDVTYFTSPDLTTFEITVPSGTDSLTIDEVVSTPTPAPTVSGANQAGAGSPVGARTPAFIGQMYVDLTAPYGLWIATGLTSADWQQLLGS